MKYLILYTAIALVGCSTSKLSREKKQSEIFVKDESDYRIVKYDYHNQWLQRVFVSLNGNSDLIDDSLRIIDIINEINTNFDLNNKSCISFFKDSVYADYFDELMKNNEEPDTLILFWKENQYLGEACNDILEFKSYPLSNDSSKIKVYSFEYHDVD